jgi:hypothetical protein
MGAGAGHSEERRRLLAGLRGQHVDDLLRAEATTLSPATAGSEK